MTLQLAIIAHLTWEIQLGLAYISLKCFAANIIIAAWISNYDAYRYYN